MLGAVLIVLLIAVPLGLLIGAVILRAAVSWYNRMSGAGSQPRQPAYAGYSANVPGGPESANPFAAPTTYGVSTVQTVGVPEPSVGYAMGIVFVSGLANLPVSLITNFIAAASPEATLPLGILSIPISFLIGAAVLKGMLPTPTFGTACLISLLQFVISLIIGVVIAVIVLVVLFATGAGLGVFGR
jgi:hypothetical protein